MKKPPQKGFEKENLIGTQNPPPKAQEGTPKGEENTQKGSELYKETPEKPCPKPKGSLKSGKRIKKPNKQKNGTQER